MAGVLCIQDTRAACRSVPEGTNPPGVSGVFPRGDAVGERLLSPTAVPVACPAHRAYPGVPRGGRPRGIRIGVGRCRLTNGQVDYGEKKCNNSTCGLYPQL